MSALVARPRLQEIGTSYIGKDGFNTVSDILRTVNRRLTGAEWGFEPCFTTRPFSTVTHDASNPGRFAFGVVPSTRGAFQEAAGVMRELGFTIATANLFDLSQDVFLSDSVVVVGPVEVPRRWMPPEARILDGTAHHYLIAEEKTGPDTLRCFDPLFGGFVDMDLNDIHSAAGEPIETIRIRMERRQSSLRTVARLCWQRGRDARIAASGPSRDGPGIRRLIGHNQMLLSGSARLRLSLSLQEFQRMRYHYSSLLGYVDVQNPNTFKIADLLYAQIVDARRALTSITTGSWAELRSQLESLAQLDDMLTALEVDG